MNKHIIVVGAGVIGLATAYQLVKAGQIVTLVEAGDQPATETSFANGGQLSYRYVSPLANSGVLGKSFTWLFNKNSPLNLKLHLSCHQLSWLLRFILACNTKTNLSNAANILRLSLLSQQTMSEWIKSGEIGNFCWSKSGKLIIYQQQHDFDKAQSQIDYSCQEVLSPSAVVTLEPALQWVKDSLVGAIYSRNEETADCYLFCQQLLSYLQQASTFNLIKQCHVQELQIKTAQIANLLTSQGNLTADEYIICAGNGSTQLLNKLNIKLPILALQGYSLTLPYPEKINTAPSISVTDYNNKIVYAKLNDRLRIAAMVDIGFDDQPIRAARITALKHTVQTTFPALKLHNAKIWSGSRPATPQGAPILGKTKFSNLWLNVGHGSLGFTLAAGCAKVLTQLIAGKNSPIALDGLEP